MANVTSDDYMGERIADLEEQIERLETELREAKDHEGVLYVVVTHGKNAQFIEVEDANGQGVSVPSTPHPNGIGMYRLGPFVLAKEG